MRGTFEVISMGRECLMEGVQCRYIYIQIKSINYTFGGKRAVEVVSLSNGVDMME